MTVRTSPVAIEPEFRFPLEHAFTSVTSVAQAGVSNEIGQIQWICRQFKLLWSCRDEMPTLVVWLIGAVSAFGFSSVGADLAFATIGVMGVNRVCGNYVDFPAFFLGWSP